MERYFMVEGEPKAKQRPRFSAKTQTVYTPSATKGYENQVRVAYQKNNFNAPMFEKGVPLALEIEAWFQIPKSASKATREKMLKLEILPTKKPDVDNIIKIIADSLNGVAYHDDSQIIVVTLKKFYSDYPKVTVTIKKMELEKEFKKWLSIDTN